MQYYGFFTYQIKIIKIAFNIRIKKVEIILKINM